VSHDPVRFCFGLHLHQPVGNFDRVFAEHLDGVYRPVLDALREGGILPVTLHLSGPLLDWLDRRSPEWLDTVGRLAADGRLELLLSGYDEPILAMLPRADRLEQIARMREALKARFGVTATGLWLTERVWEPDLPADLAAAGVEYALVDDRHFLVAGHEREALHRPWLTEAGGQTLALLAIDERLRYLVPFRPPGELADYLRTLRSAGHPLAVLADDGEKFGGWPGTREWVYERGWMREFQQAIQELVEGGEIRLTTCAQAISEVRASGPAYLPSASYREMEGWALPPARARALSQLEDELGPDRLAGPDGTLVRGTHWRHFLSKYPESNRLHKKMLALSALCRERGDPPAARRAIGRAQCNDAYWHGVFGGLYLPFLRGALWRELAEAEAILRRGQPLGVEQRDYDGDGASEVLVHDARRSVVISPARGGVIEEWLDFASGVNLAAVLTRRREAYHAEALEAAQREADEGRRSSDGAASIHDIESSLVLDALPPVDDRGRALGVDRVVSAGTTVAGFESGDVAAVADWSGPAGETAVEETAEGVAVTLTWPGRSKRILVRHDGGLEMALQWNPAALPADALVTSEWSWFEPLPVASDAAESWRYVVETVAKSERGLDRTRQGDAVVLVWPAIAGAGWVRVTPAGDAPAPAPG
jgi:hypothetical protein